MGMVWETIAAILSAVGLALLGWWLLGRLLNPIPNGAIRAVIPGRTDGRGLEQTVRALVWLRGMGLLDCPVLIEDIDLNPEGRAVAERLARRWPRVMLCTRRNENRQGGGPDGSGPGANSAGRDGLVHH